MRAGEFSTERRGTEEEERNERELLSLGRRRRDEPGSMQSCGSSSSRDTRK